MSNPLFSQRYAADALNGPLRNFMPLAQREALKVALRGEEGRAIAAIVIRTLEKIEEMPETHETDGQGDDAIVHLHYFRGSVDAWITEKDRGERPDDDGMGEQYQAFGKVNLYGTGIKDAELGYVSIAELIENDVELDLYWTQTAFKDLK